MKLRPLRQRRAADKVTRAVARQLRAALSAAMADCAAHIRQLPPAQAVEAVGAGAFVGVAPVLVEMARKYGADACAQIWPGFLRRVLDDAASEQEDLAVPRVGAPLL